MRATSMMAIVVVLTALVCGEVPVDGDEQADDQSELTIQTGKTRYSTVAYSRDSKRLAVVHSLKEIGIHDAATGVELRRIPCHTEVFNVHFAPDGEQVVSSGRGGIRFWSLADGKETRVVSTKTATRFSFSPIGGHLAAGGMRGAIIWETTTWKEVRQLSSDQRGWYSSVSFDPHGRRLATSGRREKTVKVWDVATGEKLLELEAASTVVFTTVFSPDGNKLAATDRAAFQVWDAKTGKRLFTLPRQNQYVAAFSPDSCHLATADRENMISIRDATNGDLIVTFKGHADTVLSTTFSPDGKHIASSSRDGTVKVWKIEIKKQQPE